ncbi:MAG: T9SS type A sorting domain-containing protein [Ignavibacteria bacterium]|nr:T9SS type A sorting domain-containing protein [Ignavibacteria bacterium]
MFISVNDGANWTELVNGLPDGFAATAITVSSGGIFAGHDNTGSGVPGGIYKSTNGGNNWFLSVNGLINGHVLCLAVSGTTLFAGTAAGVYVSTNDGNNWSQANGGLPGLLFINTLYSSGSNVFVGTNPPGQLFMTTNNGINWLDKNTGFSGPQYVYAILVANSYIFAGKYHSVWRRLYSDVIGIKNISTEIPGAYSLGQNYPNPFNPTTNIEFNIPKASSIRLIIFDEKGGEVKEFDYTVSLPGKYMIEIDAGDLPSGVYFYKLLTVDFSAVKKMLLIK